MNPATFFSFGNWKHKSLHFQAAVTQSQLTGWPFLWCQVVKQAPVAHLISGGGEVCM
jgi:hypothetical protein